MSITAISADGVPHVFPDGTADAIVDKAMKAYAAEQAPRSSVVDAARSIPGGLAKGVAGLVGLPGDVQTMISGERATGLPTSKTIGNAMAAPFGGFYEPQTTAGKYAETIASFAPAAAFPGGAVARAARVAVPGAASQAGGDIGQKFGGDTGETIGRVVGGLGGGLAVAAAPRSISRISGSANRHPEREAVRRLQEAAQRDNPATVGREMQDWRASGASDPSLLDVSGNNVQRLIRSAAAGAEGEAQNTATSYANRIAGNLQDRAVTQARRLTPNNTRSATAVADELETAQGNLAARDYAGPYAEPVTLTPESIAALRGPDGQAAIRRAIRAAQARQNHAQQNELQTLLTADLDVPVTISAGALDRVQIAMGRGGQAALQDPRTRDVAGGLFQRQAQVDASLDAVPGLQPARATYRDFQAQREGVDVGRTGLNATGDEYAAQITELAGRSPAAREAAGVGYRQSITDAIQRPAEGSTGTLNRLATSNNQTQNLETTFGQQPAERFQAALQREIRRVNKSRSISPNTGSQTEPRLTDRALVDAVFSPRSGLFRMATDWLRGSATLTPAERAAVVRLGTSEVDLQRLLQNLPAPRRAQLARQFAAQAQLSGGNTPRQ